MLVLFIVSFLCNPGESLPSDLPLTLPLVQTSPLALPSTVRLPYLRSGCTPERAGAQLDDAHDCVVRAGDYRDADKAYNTFNSFVESECALVSRINLCLELLNCYPAETISESITPGLNNYFEDRAETIRLRFRKGSEFSYLSACLGQNEATGVNEALTQVQTIHLRFYQK